MTLEKKQYGKLGEDFAADFLKQKGYRIVERNFRAPLGEIDIVAWENDTLCFIEVKSRSTVAKGTALEAVSWQKQRKLSQLALIYLKQKRLLEQKARFDVVAVTKNRDESHSIEILENAFELNSRYAY